MSKVYKQVNFVTGVSGAAFGGGKGGGSRRSSGKKKNNTVTIAKKTETASLTLIQQLDNEINISCPKAPLGTTVTVTGPSTSTGKTQSENGGWSLQGGRAELQAGVNKGYSEGTSTGQNSGSTTLSAPCPPKVTKPITPISQVWQK
jgi:hypothetical protein